MEACNSRRKGPLIDAKGSRAADSLHGSQVYTSTLSSGISPSDYLEAHQAISELVLPAPALAKVMATPSEKNLGNIKHDIHVLVKSGHYGCRLFASLSRKLVAESVQDCIDRHLKSLMTTASIDTITLLLWERKVREEIESLPNFDMLPAKREVTLKFHEVSFTYGVSSPGQHVELAVRACLRAWAVSASRELDTSTW